MTNVTGSGSGAVSGPRHEDMVSSVMMTGIAVVMFFMLDFLEYALGIPRLLPVMILNVGLAAAIGWMMKGLVTGLATGLIGSAFAGSGLPQAPDHSPQETLIARGKYREAAESFEKHLLAHTDDIEARLKLARLHEQHLGDDRAAEESYLAARRRLLTPQQDALVANSLIDLYRRTSQRGRLMVELARFAERYRGSPAGEAAARELAELKA